MLNKKQKSILGLHGQSMPRSKQLTKNAAIFSAISKFFRHLSKEKENS